MQFNPKPTVQTVKHAKHAKVKRAAWNLQSVIRFVDESIISTTRLAFACLAYLAVHSALSRFNHSWALILSTAGRPRINTTRHGRNRNSNKRLGLGLRKFTQAAKVFTNCSTAGPGSEGFLNAGFFILEVNWLSSSESVFIGVHPWFLLLLLAICSPRRLLMAPFFDQMLRAAQGHGGDGCGWIHAARRRPDAAVENEKVGHIMAAAPGVHH